MRNVLLTAALAGSAALATSAAIAPGIDVPIQVARAMVDGVILGSSAWPSVPVDGRARLQLRSAACDRGAYCDKATPATPAIP